ncbi:DUF6779 domain-containing protein [Corynebacterium striatum]|uniref:DUF6779 domain-containing protein n=1 Tax=Corynebacterium striatum TaxID=43770 RepID=UPI00254A4B89|nr:DUF6779 domain-containing protein [Corynebacterium striatum]MDK8806694.1 hypothetical protein [Corynebacterium striatum]MDK8825005.1 hypothetical protein [Corynebacterium striatum]MDK8881284.1 hypothetical protein [Corynebacterium striatum]HCT3315625.1 hypothetical protein [Corynebacterium striatum]
MTAPNPNAINSAPKKADAGSIGLIVLVILAVIASMVMLISGSASALKLALIAALWAAVLGFFLVVRYRREAAESAALLEAERSRQPAPVQQDSDIMEEIRRELASIRAQIEELSGREFTYEPAALHAEARRIMELEEKTREPEVNFTQASKGAPTADAVAGRLGSQPSAPRTPQHNPLDDIIAQRVQQRNEQKAPAQQPVPPQTAPKQHFPAGQSAQVSPQSTFDTASFQTVRWDGQQSTHAKPEAPAQQRSWQQATSESQQPKPASHKHRAPEQTESRGRRRSDEPREGAVSVAELMAAMKKKK